MVVSGAVGDADGRLVGLRVTRVVGECVGVDVGTEVGAVVTGEADGWGVVHTPQLTGHAAAAEVPSVLRSSHRDSGRSPIHEHVFEGRSAGCHEALSVHVGCGHRHMAAAYE